MLQKVNKKEYKEEKKSFFGNKNSVIYWKKLLLDVIFTGIKFTLFL